MFQSSSFLLISTRADCSLIMCEPNSRCLLLFCRFPSNDVCSFILDVNFEQTIRQYLPLSSFDVKV